MSPIRPYQRPMTSPTEAIKDTLTLMKLFQRAPVFDGKGGASARGFKSDFEEYCTTHGVPEMYWARCLMSYCLQGIAATRLRSARDDTHGPHANVSYEQLMELLLHTFAPSQNNVVSDMDTISRLRLTEAPTDTDAGQHFDVWHHEWSNIVNRVQLDRGTDKIPARELIFAFKKCLPLDVRQKLEDLFQVYSGALDSKVIENDRLLHKMTAMTRNLFSNPSRTPLAVSAGEHNTTRKRPSSGVLETAHQSKKAAFTETMNPQAFKDALHEALQPTLQHIMTMQQRNTAQTDNTNLAFPGGQALKDALSEALMPTLTAMQMTLRHAHGHVPPLLRRG